MSELKCCPFCGGEAILVKNGAGCYQVACDNCEVRQYAYAHKNKESAINAWNTRKPMANIVENIVTSLENEKTVFLGTRTEQTGTILIDDAINIVKQEINNGLE